MRSIHFDPDAWEDFLFWLGSDRKMATRITRLIREIQRDPFTGVGKPEPLKGDLSGYWSRRVDDEHRLVYRADDKEVKILKARYHYGTVAQSPFDFSDFKAAAYTTEMTLDMYEAFPEDASKQIEVVDGWMVRCESAEPSHQAIQFNLIAGLREAAKVSDRRKGTCHRVLGDVDVLIADSPRLHFRRPDLVVYRCVDADRGKWGKKPYASDCVIAVEIVSADSVTTDLRDKRAEYAAAGIPNYWIVRMTDNDGPAISVERFLLTLEGDYVREGFAVRGRDFRAVDTINPFPLRLTWEQLDDGL